MARLALVCEPPDGGVAEHVAQLALGLLHHGHEPTVFAPAGFAHTERMAAGGVKVRTLPFRRDYMHPHLDALSLGKLVDALRAGRFALAHGHAAKAGVLARVAAAITRRPAVYTPHCFPFVGDGGAARNRVVLTTERRLAPLTAAIICVCQAELDLAQRLGIVPRRLMSVVYNGCPASQNVRVDPELARLRARGPVIGAIAVLRPQKRLEVLIDAAAQLFAAVPDLSVVIVGDGPQASRLRARALALGVDVAFVPYRGPSERALQALDAYVLPSAWEALPIGLLEAQACGVPQVATDVGGNREVVVPETGILVGPDDPPALAKAVITLLRNPERRQAMGVASRARHASRFTVERMVAETAAVYDEVLA